MNKASRHTGFEANRMAIGKLSSVLLCMVVAGCGTTEQSSLSGKVTYRGKPVQSGVMRLFPISGTPGDGAGVNIEGGAYSLAEDRGLVPGKYRVSILGMHETGRKLRNPEPLPGESAVIMETIQYVPEKYNLRSGLQVELVAGDNQKDFSLD